MLRYMSSDNRTLIVMIPYFELFFIPLIMCISKYDVAQQSFVDKLSDDVIIQTSFSHKKDTLPQKQLEPYFSIDYTYEGISLEATGYRNERSRIEAIKKSQNIITNRRLPLSNHE